MAVKGIRIQVQTAEEVQDAISGMYAILQLHGSYVTSQCGATGPAAIIDAAEAMMLLLQVCLFSGLFIAETNAYLLPMGVSQLTSHDM